MKFTSCPPRVRHAPSTLVTVNVVEPPMSDMPRVAPLTVSAIPAAPATRQTVFDIDKLSVSYGPALAVKDATLEIYKNSITALIGPSGCGKSTFLRCLNRMNDLVPNVRIDRKS